MDSVRANFVKSFMDNRLRLIGFFGLLGAGKTAMAVIFVRMLQRMYNQPIASNIELKLPNCKRYDLSELVSVDFVDTIVLADEIVTQADARLSMTIQNVYYSYFVSQARKSPHRDGGRGEGNHIVYTAQLQSMADLRLFELSNFWGMMEQYESGDFHLEWVNDLGECGDSDVPCYLLWNEAKPYYSTDEKVMPFAISSMQVDMEKFIPEKMNKRIDSVVEDFLGVYDFNSWRDVQRFTVNDFLRRRGVPEKLGVAVFDRVRYQVRVRSWFCFPSGWFVLFRVPTEIEVRVCK